MSATDRVNSHPVLLFDGECGLCQRLVRLLLRIDASKSIRFAPLQGTSAQAFLLLRGLPTSDFESLVWIPDWSQREHGNYFLRTDGVIAAGRACQRWSTRLVAAGLAAIPRRLRDAGYRFVGRMRYRVFGPWRPRPLARPEWSERFLP